MQGLFQILSVENEFLSKIIVLPLVFIEVYIMQLVATTILNINPSKKQKYIFITLLYLIGAVSTFILPANIKSFTSLLLAFLLIQLVFKGNLLQTFLATVLILAGLAISEAITSTIFKILFGVNPLIIINTPITRMLYQPLTYSFFYLFYIFLDKFKNNIIAISELSKKTKMLLAINCIFGILTIFPNAIFIIEIIKDSSKLLYIYMLASTLIYFSISIYTTFKSSELELTKRDLENNKIHTKQQKLLMDNLKAFKHDNDNTLQVIGSLIETENLSKLKEYFSSLNQDCSAINTLIGLDPDVINHPAVFGLIIAKYDLAMEKDVELNVTVAMNLNKINFDMYKFTKILGILLDNAIEAASFCDEKVVNVIMREDHINKKQFLIIENTYANKEIDIGKIFEKDYTTKKGNTGLGLWEVSAMASKYIKKIYLDTIKEDKYFKQQLEINI